MAITIDTEPTGTLFAYRPLLNTVTSDSVTIARVIADIYVSGSYIASMESAPNLGTTDEFSFDIQGVVQDSLEGRPIDPTDGIGTTETNLKEVFVKFYEVTESGGVLSTTWAEDGAGTGAVTSTTFKAIDGTLFDTDTNEITQFQNGGTYYGLSKDLKPIRRIKENDFVHILLPFNTAAPLIRYTVNFYSDTTGFISSLNSTNVASTYDMIYARFDSSNVVAGTDYFRIKIQTSTATNLSNEIEYRLVRDCNDDFVSLYWFNSVGGLDYHLFEGKKVKKVRSKTSTFKQALPSTHNAINRSRTVATIEGVEQFECYTRPQTEESLIHLSELITHKSDVHVYENGVYRPVIITSATEKVNNSSDSVAIFKITYQYSNNLQSQKG